MDIKHGILIGAGALGSLFLGSCGDTDNLLGSSVQPESDRISVYADTFRITASTVKIDSVYAKTTSCYLGEFYDPLYGRLKSDYLCQFYCEDGFKFRQTPYEGKVDSVMLYLEFTGWAGDAYAPMEIKVHSVTGPLEKNFYSNVDAGALCDLQNVLGTQVASVANARILDIDSAESTSGMVYTYYRVIGIRLPIEIGQKFYDATVQNPSAFSSQDAFNRFFPGLYVTTGFGSGTQIHIDRTFMDVWYRYTGQSSTGGDSLMTAAELFMTAKDVIQMNCFESTDMEQLLADNDECTFLKTPAGIYTRLEIPAKEIGEIIKDRIVNNLPFDIKYLPQENWLYSLTPPPYLLLLPEDSLTSFFENGSIENNVTYYLSTVDVASDGSHVPSPVYSPLGYSSSSRTYSFKNIAPLLNYHLSVSPDADLKMLIVPVNRAYQESQQSYSSSTVYYYTTAITPWLAPSGLKLRKDGDYMKITLLSSKFLSR
jgi:hypothetical protein